MWHPTILAMVVKGHHSNLRAEVEKSRIPKTAWTARPGLQERLLMRVADVLIRAGMRLQRRYRPEVCPHPQAYPNSAR